MVCGRRICTCICVCVYKNKVCVYMSSMWGACFTCTLLSARDAQSLNTITAHFQVCSDNHRRLSMVYACMYMCVCMHACMCTTKRLSSTHEKYSPNLGTYQQSQSWVTHRYQRTPKILTKSHAHKTHAHETENERERHSNAQTADRQQRTDM